MGMEKVVELLREDGVGWDVQKVQACFLPFEVDDVLGIPLSSVPLEDEFVWGYDKAREYKVKLGYHFITFAKHSLQGGEGSSEGTKVWWDIWSINVPPKVHVCVEIVLWCASHFEGYA